MEYSGLDIVALRKKYKLSQKELAVRIGASYKTILNYEKTGIVTKTKWPALDAVVKEEEAKINGSPDSENSITLNSINSDFMNPNEVFEMQKEHIATLKKQISMLEEQNNLLKQNLEDCLRSNGNLKNTPVVLS